MMILDINEGRVTSEFSEGGKVAIEMEWLKHHEVSHDLLMVLHSPGTLVLWNADTGVKLWKKAFVDPLLSFALDPFNGKTITGNKLSFTCDKLEVAIFNVLSCY